MIYHYHYNLLTTSNSRAKHHARGLTQRKALEVAHEDYTSLKLNESRYFSHTRLFSIRRRPCIGLSITHASLDVKAMKLFHLYVLISAQSMYVQCLYEAPSTKEFFNISISQHPSKATTDF